MRILTADPKGGVVHTLAIRGRVLLRVYARPSRLFARLTPGSPPPRLRCSAVAADPGFGLEAEPLEWPRDEVEIQVVGRTSSRLDFGALLRPDRAGELIAEMTFSADDPDDPRVVVPWTRLRAPRPWGPQGPAPRIASRQIPPLLS